MINGLFANFVAVPVPENSFPRAIKAHIIVTSVHRHSAGSG
jgi:hypothetical protein